MVDQMWASVKMLLESGDQLTNPQDKYEQTLDTIFQACTSLERKYDGAESSTKKKRR